MYTDKIESALVKSNTNYEGKYHDTLGALIHNRIPIVVGRLWADGGNNQESNITHHTTWRHRAVAQMIAERNLRGRTNLVRYEH